MEALIQDYRKLLLQYSETSDISVWSQLKTCALSLKEFLIEHKAAIEKQWEKTWGKAGYDPNGPEGWKAFWNGTMNCVENVVSAKGPLPIGGRIGAVEMLNEEFSELYWLLTNNPPKSSFH